MTPQTTSERVRLQKHYVDGALPGFKTHGIVQHPQDGHYVWHSRRSRKKRHHTELKTGESRFEASTLRRILRIITAIEYWNISWWVAMVILSGRFLCDTQNDPQLFTVGSIVWCINGFIVFLPVSPVTSRSRMTEGGANHSLYRVVCHKTLMAGAGQHGSARLYSS